VVVRSLLKMVGGTPLYYITSISACQ